MRMRDFSQYLWYRTRVKRITSRAAVGWFCWRSRTTWPKTWIIPARLERAFTLAKNFSEISAEFQKSRCGGGFFDSGFFWLVRGSCLATFKKIFLMRERFGFFYASVNGTYENALHNTPVWDMDISCAYPFSPEIKFRLSKVQITLAKETT